MRLIHLDAVGGVAGDMFAAALLDALPELRTPVLEGVRRVLPPAAAVTLEEGSSGAVRALRFAVTLPPGRPQSGGHSHGHASLGETHYPALATRIASAGLPEAAARHAGAILTLLAEAEARIHQVPLASVHFHEIADWDSLADVVAAGCILQALGDVVWTVSPLPRGGGLVRTEHGLLPVPAPATAALLEGFAWRDDGVPGERVTPTGAAILRHLGPGAAPAGAHRLEGSGTGAGSRALEGLPNILRALVFTITAAPRGERVAVVSFDIDDMTGEELAWAAERLRLLDGVLDVALSPASGKKGRPLTCFRVLAREEALAGLQEACLHQTSTLGLRWHIEDRVVLRREQRQGAGLRVKCAERPGGCWTAKVESDDLEPAAGLAERRHRQRAAEDAAGR
jgi:hypothetical protein